MTTTPRESNVLAGGFYTPRDAARILRLDGPERVRGWIAGYPGRAEPVLRRDHEPVAGKQSLSFWDLVEVRFLDHFRRQGVSMPTLRKAAVRARAAFGTDHPFALSNVRFMTDRRHIFAAVAEETNDEKTWNLVSGQSAFYAVIEESLARGVAFDPVSNLAERFAPIPEFGNVIVHPRLAFGKPVIAGPDVPTAALLRMWRAEGGDTDRVARAFAVPPAAVNDAVRFEAALGA